MKTIANLKLKRIKFLTLFFFLSLLVTVGQRANAQTIDVLLNSDWHLIESSVDDASISLENSGGLVFYSPNNEDFFLHYYGESCFESFKVNFTDVTQTSFNLSTVFDYESCDYTNPDEIEAIELYHSFYFNLPFGTNSTPKNPFIYEWVDNGQTVEDLVITNAEGDWLLYRTDHLSTPAAKKNSFRLYPNPTENILNLSSANNIISNANISIHDILGKLVKFENNRSIRTNITLNISHLKSGLYFLTIEDKEGFKQTLKFIKQ